MERLMSIQRIFSLFGCIIALFGIVGSLRVPLYNKGIESLGIGVFPLVYSLALLLFGVIVFFSDKSDKKFNFRVLLEGPGRKIFVFFLLNILLLLMVFLFGPFIAVLVFSILACFNFKRQTMRSIVLFSVIFTIVFYVIFVRIFKIPFARGEIFEMLGWYI
jgi:hypothetical protein